MGGLPRGRNAAKRNVVIRVESMGWVAKGEGNVDKRNVKILKKRNVVLEPESLKAWVAKGGGSSLDKKNVVIIESMGWVAKGGRKFLIK